MSDQLTTELRPEIRRVIGRLRRRIRKYLFLEGLALVLIALGVLFWVSLGLDYVYFSLSNLELPRWFRAAFGIVVICVFALGGIFWIGLGLVRRLRTKALALILERRFPELDDRLITAVELSESRGEKESPLTASMLKRTVGEVSRIAENLDLDRVFERKPLRRAMVLATILVASIGGLAWANQEALQRWKQGYWDLKQEYWNRETELIVKVIAQPGDRVKEFEDHVYKHPRGSDLTLLIEVPKGKEVPQRIQFQHRLADGRGSGRTYLSPMGEGRFQHSIGGLLDSLEFWVSGGDYINRQPYRIETVDPPEIDRIVLQSLYPDYTDLNLNQGPDRTVARDPREVQGTQISLPMETDLLMQAQVNKPLVGGRLQTEFFEIHFDEDSAQLIILPQNGGARRTFPLPPEIGQNCLSEDCREFTLPFQLEANAVKQLVELEDSVELPLPLPADSLIRIYLEDRDGILSARPERLTINGIVDQPPVVETELQGVSSSITRKATVPIGGVISDDYGISRARFEYRLDNDENWLPRRLQNRPENTPKEFRLQMSADEAFERFEVLPLDLSLGDKLILTVYAQDNDNLNGPHTGRGERYAFDIVSEEELLSILYARELNLRRRFERIITEVRETQQDLILHRTRIQEGKELQNQFSSENKLSSEQRKELKEIETAVSASAERALHAIRKNANETSAIEASFRDILKELTNNALHSPQMMTRVGDLIVTPLHNINTVDYPSIDEKLGLFKLANEEGRDPTQEIDASLNAIAQMLEHMQAVLAEMKDLMKFHQALEELKSIIGEEQDLIEETKEKRKKSLIEGLKDLGEE